MDHERQMAEDLQALVRILAVAVCDASGVAYTPERLIDYAYGNGAAIDQEGE